MKEAAKKAGATILEPVMAVEITCPDEYLGDVLGTISSRRGAIKNMDDRKGIRVIDCDVPLSEMFGYATTLRSATQGRGNYTMQLSHYTEVPRSEFERITGKK